MSRLPSRTLLLAGLLAALPACEDAAENAPEPGETPMIEAPAGEAATPVSAPAESIMATPNEAPREEH